MGEEIKTDRQKEIEELWESPELRDLAKQLSTTPEKEPSKDE